MVGDWTLSQSLTAPAEGYSEYICPRACRAMWAEVMRAAIADGATQLRRAHKDSHPGIIKSLRSYFGSRDCGHVLEMAGIDLDADRRADILMQACFRAMDRQDATKRGFAR